MSIDVSATVAKDRYPGLRSFGAGQKAIFFGRDGEIRDLFQLVSIEQIILLFSKSGLGKSSLLEAGLSPKLQETGFQPIRIRFQPQKSDTDQTVSTQTPLQIVLDELANQFDKAFLDLQNPSNQSSAAVESSTSSKDLAYVSYDKGSYTSNQRVPYWPENEYDPTSPCAGWENKLWEQVKMLRFPKGRIPVLIFDQFEEFFDYPLPDQQAFLSQLAELLHDQPPSRIINWLLDLPIRSRTADTITWSQQPPIKCIFAIRSDRLFEMHKMKSIIPLIMRNRYELLPLEDNNARQAIDQPAKVDGDFSSPKFRFDEDAREEIITVLSHNASNQENCAIESSQLQIVCNYAEELIKAKAAANQPLVVTKDDLTKTKPVRQILNDFYHTQLQSIGSPEEIELVRPILEQLVVNHQRVALAKSRMEELLTGHEDLIEKLETARIIRPEETHLGTTYELSHDTLIQAVEKDALMRQQQKAQQLLEQERQQREEQFRQQQLELNEERKQKMRSRVLAVLFFVLLLIGGFFLYQVIRLRGTAINLLAEDAYESGNQSLAFRLWEENRNLSSQLKSRLFAPFAGTSTQFDVADSTLAFVATIYKDNLLDVWQRGNNGYKKSKELSVQPPTAFRLKNNFLAFAEGDSLLQIWDLLTNKKIFPTGRGRYRLLTSNSLRTQSQAERTAAGRAIKSVISPRGRWFITLDSINLAHLYQLKRSNKTIYLKEHDFFQDAINDIQAKTPFTLDLANNFSANENFLLIKHPAADTYYLYNLALNQPATVYSTTVFAQFSPSGRYLATVSTTGQLTVKELATQTVRYNGQIFQPTRLGAFADLTFTRHDSTIVVVTSHPKTPVNTGLSYNLFAIDIAAATSALRVIDRSVSSYQLFGQAGRVLVTTPAMCYNYAVATAQKVSCPFSKYTVFLPGRTCMLYMQNRASGTPDNQIHLYDVLRNRSINLSRFVSGTKQQVAFYTSPEGVDQKLIYITPRQLRFFDLKKSAQSGQFLYFEQISSLNSRFALTGLSVSGVTVKARLQDGMLVTFFINNNRNKTGYLQQHYPTLTQAEKQRFGLIY